MGPSLVPPPLSVSLPPPGPAALCSASTHVSHHDDDVYCCWITIKLCAECKGTNRFVSISVSPHAWPLASFQKRRRLHGNMCTDSYIICVRVAGMPIYGPGRRVQEWRRLLRIPVQIHTLRAHHMCAYGRHVGGAQIVLGPINFNWLNSAFYHKTVVAVNALSARVTEGVPINNTLS